MATTNVSVKTFLWFDKDGEEAAKFYVDVFGGQLTTRDYYPPGSHRPHTELLTVGFTIRGQEFLVLNGGPHFKPTPAVSFSIACDTQEELDRYWDKILAHGGEESQCGWISDKWGFSWQIVPTILAQLTGDPDPAKAERATKAMLGMKRLNIQQLRDAHAGK